MNENKPIVIGYAPAIVNTCTTVDSWSLLDDDGREKDPERPAITINEALVCQLLAYDIANYPNRYSPSMGLSTSYNAIVRRLHHVLSFASVRKIVASLVKKGVLNAPMVMKKAKANHKLHLSFKDATIGKLAGKDLIYFIPAIAHKIGIKGAILHHNLSHWTKKNTGKEESRTTTYAMGITEWDENKGGYNMGITSWDDTSRDGFDGWIAQPTNRLSVLTGMSVRTVQYTLNEMENAGVVETRKMVDGTNRIRLGYVGRLEDVYKASERKPRSKAMTVAAPALPTLTTLASRPLDYTVLPFCEDDYPTERNPHYGDEQTLTA